jgi:hypothetical protein
VTAIPHGGLCTGTGTLCSTDTKAIMNLNPSRYEKGNRDGKRRSNEKRTVRELGVVDHSETNQGVQETSESEYHLRGFEGRGYDVGGSEGQQICRP